MKRYTDEWKRTLAGTKDGVDVIGSLSEAAINAYLTKHFEYDKAKYKVEKTIVGKVVQGGRTVDLPITIRVQAKSALAVDLKPLTSSRGVSGKWTQLDKYDPEPNLNVPNVGVRMDKLAFSVEWKSVYAPGETYTWSPSPIRVEAKAVASLHTEDEPEEESRHLVRLVPTQVRFDRPERYVMEQELREVIARIADPADRKLVTKYAVDRFDELLVIALNTAATELAPNFVQNVELPLPVVAQKTLVPRAMSIEKDLLTVAFGLDEGRLRDKAAETLNAACVDVQSALEQDIAKAGGLAKLVVKNGQRVDLEDLEQVKKVKLRSAKEIEAKLTQLRRVETRWTARTEATIEAAERQSVVRDTRVKLSAKDGFGVAISEHLLDTLADSFDRRGPKECTDWLSLGVVRGRACYWARMYDADITLSGSSRKLTVDGNIEIDVGGSLEGCVRKFWDCSWRWACSELRMALRERPGISIDLLDDKFVALKAKLTGQVRLETNLPFPFNKIAQAVGALVWAGLKAIINAFLSTIQIVIVPPKLPVPKQKTAIDLRNFDSFFFKTPDEPRIGPKGRFAGVVVDVVPVKA